MVCVKNNCITIPLTVTKHDRSGDERVCVKNNCITITIPLTITKHDRSEEYTICANNNCIAIAIPKKKHDRSRWNVPITIV